MTLPPQPAAPASPSSLPPPTPLHSEIDSENWTTYAPIYDSYVGRVTRISADRLVTLTHTLKPYTVPNTYLHDNGAGTGGLTYVLKGRFPAVRVLATDISPGMLDVIEKARWPYVETKVHDASGKGAADKLLWEMGEKSETENTGAQEKEEGSTISIRQRNSPSSSKPPCLFTHVLSTFMIQFLPDPQTVVQEMYRELHPGGVIGLAIWDADNGASATWKEACRRVDPTYQPPPTDHDESAWLSTAEMERALGEAGFEDIRTETVRVRFETESTEEFMRFWFEDRNPSAVGLINDWKGDLEVVRKEMSRIVRDECEDGRAIFIKHDLAVGRRPTEVGGSGGSGCVDIC